MVLRSDTDYKVFLVVSFRYSDCCGCRSSYLLGSLPDFTDVADTALLHHLSNIYVGHQLFGCFG
jgi:hypothetical protein